MDYMRMIQDTVEYEKMIEKQEKERKEYEKKQQMNRAIERLLEVKDDVVLVINVLRAIADADKRKLEVPFDTSGTKGFYRSYDCHYDGHTRFYFGAKSDPRGSTGVELGHQVAALGWYWEKSGVWGGSGYYSYAYDGEKFYCQKHDYGEPYPQEVTPEIIYDFCNKFEDYKVRFDKRFKENFTVGDRDV